MPSSSSKQKSANLVPQSIQFHRVLLKEIMFPNDLFPRTTFFGQTQADVFIRARRRPLQSFRLTPDTKEENPFFEIVRNHVRYFLYSLRIIVEVQQENKASLLVLPHGANVLGYEDFANALPSPSYR